MAVEVVKEIRDAEARADELKKRAAESAKQTVNASSEEAEKRYADALEEAEKAFHETVRAKEGEAKSKASQMLDDSSKRCRTVSNVDPDRMNRAVELIIERIVKPDVNS